MLGGTLGLSAIARDDHPGVREVVFEVESTNGWNAVATVPNNTGTRVSYVANYTPQAAGPIRLRARAVDHGGLESVSNAVNVLVTDDVNPGWTSLDIGAVAIGGSRAGTPPNVVLMMASGADIWGTADAFRYTYTQLVGNGTIIGRVSALHAPHAWSKAGLMLRQSPTASSPHAFMFVSRDHGLAFQRRTAAGASTVHTGGGDGVAPQWLRLARTGEVVTASFSPDGVTWTDVGSEVLPIGTGPVLVGMALTSHSDTEVASAAFENVSIMP